MNWRTQLLLLAGFALLVGCMGEQRGVDACVDPKLLRVKVGDTLFDLPNTVGSLGSSSRKLGVVTIGQRAHHSDPANRWDCNSKAHPVADFGEELGFVYRGDGSEPKDYRLGDKMYAIVRIVKYRPDSDAEYRRTYLANVEDIEKVRFVERVDHPRIARERIKDATFTFSYDGKNFDLECQVGWYSSADRGEESLQPKHPNLCVPDARFRAADILISVDQRGRRHDNNHASPIPPEEWPKQWAYTINRVLSFRVQGEKEAGR